MEYDIFERLIGSKYYYKKGTDLFHREDGPAIEYSTGNKEWWINDAPHRTDGPAIERVNGDKEWWINGERHRTNGPAIECSNGDKEWWINDRRLSPEKEAILNKWWNNKNGI